MNKVQQALLERLGLELDQEFEFDIDGGIDIYKFILENEIFLIRQKRDGCWDAPRDYMFNFILTYPERVKPLPKFILDRGERKYLEGVLRPFKNEVIYILMKQESCVNASINIYFKHNEFMFLPDFKIGTMYKGMQMNKKYTLEELGLFQNEY